MARLYNDWRSRSAEQRRQELDAPLPSAVASSSMSNLTTTPSESSLPSSPRLDHNDANSVTMFGSDNQRKLGQFSSELLTRVRANKIGEIGDTILRLQEQIGHVEMSASDEEETLFKRMMASIPGLRKLVKKGEAFANQFDSVAENLEDIKMKLDKGKLVLDKDNTTMEVMKRKQREYINAITEDIKEGRAKLEEMRTVVIPELQRKIENETSEDDMELAVDQLSEYTRFVNILDKKVAELHANKAHANLTLPQIRIIQDGNVNLINQLDSAMYDAIPIWLNQVVVSMATDNQAKAVKMKTLFATALNESVVKNADRIHQNSVSIARESEKTTITIESLKAVGKSLSATLEDVLKIQGEGQRQRALLEGQLLQVESDVRTKAIRLAAATVDVNKRLTQ